MNTRLIFIITEKFFFGNYIKACANYIHSLISSWRIAAECYAECIRKGAIKIAVRLSCDKSAWNVMFLINLHLLLVIVEISILNSVSVFYDTM